MCQSNLSGLWLPTSLLLSTMYLEIVLQCPCKTITVRTACGCPLISSPNSTCSVTLLSSILPTCGGPVWQSVLVGWLHTKTLLLMMILTCHLMFKHYSQIHEKNQVNFSNLSLSQSCVLDHTVLLILSKSSSYDLILFFVFFNFQKTCLSS